MYRHISDLPPPPPDKIGWPWTAESIRFPVTQTDSHHWPRISIVTPSYNQASYLEATIRSVLLQGYPNLEYIVIDGGSSDGSVDIIHKYASWLAYWVSEPDQGQYDAINKGFSYSTGEIMAWLNSDDMYVPNSLYMISEVFTQLKNSVQWITGLSAYWNDKDFLFHINNYPRYSAQLIRLGYYDGRGFNFIQQESTFWTRELWQKAGGKLDTNMELASDFELWCRFAQFTELFFVPLVLGGFRVHTEQKTAKYMSQYLAEVDRYLFKKRWRGVTSRLAKTTLGRRLIGISLKILRKNKIIIFDPLQSTWKIQHY